MRLPKIFIFLFLIVFSYQDSEDDEERCSKANVNECQSITMTDSNIECCKYTYLDIKASQSQEGCTSIVLNEINDEVIELSSKQNKEVDGFYYTLVGKSYSDYQPTKITINCKSKTFTIDYSLGTFTNEEIEI